jgi:metal-sulfur cluster biosynthetic enzyme
MLSKSQVLDSLRKVYDPEIGINIVDVGLVYRVEEIDGVMEVDFTLTSPGCPLADSIEADMRTQIKADHGVKDEELKTSLVWDPPWTIEYMSEEARLDLGYPI